MPQIEQRRRLPDTVTLKNIGSNLLEELAKGLYKPDEMLREYIQNAIDAHRLWRSESGEKPAGPIQVEIRGERISILDRGNGMDEDEIRNVKSIAVSKKPKADIPLTGHKGVGIWAGLSYFETLTVTTTRRGSSLGYELVIHFKRIVESISDETSIDVALDPNYEIFEIDADPDTHYTDVTLSVPTRSADFFLTLDTVRQAIQRICPCEIAPSFTFHDELLAWYKQNGIEIFPIKLNGNPVHRSYPSKVEGFKTGTITLSDVPVAIYWHAINEKNRGLAAAGDELMHLRIIQDGFTLGGENPYGIPGLDGYEPFQQAVVNYLNWYIGEIYIRWDAVRPNLQRDAFEASPEADQFIKRLRRWYVTEIHDRTRVLSEVRNELRTYRDDYEPSVTAIEHLGSPLLHTLDSQQRADLMRIKSSLTDEEKTVDDNKGKSNVHYKTGALRNDQVKAQRKRLLQRIDNLIPVEADISPLGYRIPSSEEGLSSTRPDGTNRVTPNSSSSLSADSSGRTDPGLATAPSPPTYTTPLPSVQVRVTTDSSDSP